MNQPPPAGWEGVWQIVTLAPTGLHASPVRAGETDSVPLPVRTFEDLGIPPRIGVLTVPLPLGRVCSPCVRPRNQRSDSGNLNRLWPRCVIAPAVHLTNHRVVTSSRISLRWRAISPPAAAGTAFQPPQVIRISHSKPRSSSKQPRARPLQLKRGPVLPIARTKPRAFATDLPRLPILAARWRFN
jgi:hypothetical protein